MLLVLFHEDPDNFPVDDNGEPIDPDDQTGPLIGMFWGALFSLPLWVALAVAIWMVVRHA